MDWKALGDTKRGVLEKSRDLIAPPSSLPVFLLLRQLSLQSEVLTQTADVAFAMSKSRRSGSQSASRHVAALYHRLPSVADRWTPYLSKPKTRAPR